MINFPQSLHLIESFKKSDDYLLIKEIESIRRSFNIFSGNYKDLRNALDEHNLMSSNNSLWESKEIRWEIQDRLTRLLFNFCSAAAALVPHTRNHRDKLYNQADKIFIEYEEFLDKEFRNNLEHHFIIGLRNFISHDKLPAIVSIKRFHGKITTTSFNIKKSSLEFEDSNWKAKAKDFINDQQENIDVEKLVDRYFLRVEELHNWYSHRQLQHHKEIYAKVIHEKKTLLRSAIEDRITTALPYDQEDIDREEQVLNSL
ncbi:hypothetical protein [Pontibacter mangrovi]|uniref:Cthe-2314-like HEPN domain-containing protein n=1 Tax=Pontibacter mangrovi TaxID=2589816 RepID=A0A501W0I6_9BACT|nr:hypothetical protein [Pontibacter mangrovi]TPE40277.1 hypothetical protein FJM65_20260 [Pontibacter mangrovi]